jgi:hypothetical protein
MLKCTICGSEFEENETERKLIESRVAKGWGTVAVDCTSCGLSFTFDVDPGAAPLGLRCPEPSCTGLVLLSSGWNGMPHKWLCGECGNAWLHDEELNAAVSNIVNRFPRRKMVYQHRDGGWFPVPLDFEPSEYRELVESEPWKETLLCYLKLGLAPEVPPLARQRVVEVVNQLRATTATNAKLVDEVKTEPANQELDHPQDEATAVFGVRLDMRLSEPERKNLTAAEAVLDGLRQLTTDGE